MGVEYYFRGFVAITLVQQLGILVQIYIDPDSLQRAFLQQTLAKKEIRPYVALFFVNSIHQLILKATLQCAFSNRPLHIVHALSSLAHFTFFTLEIFVYEYFQQSAATFTQLLFSGLTVLLTSILWSSISDENSELVEKESKPRRLTARHYTESQVKDFGTDPNKLR